jgi:hypothetical protein
MAVNYGILTLEKVGLEVPQQFTAALFYNIGPWSQFPTLDVNVGVPHTNPA